MPAHCLVIDLDRQVDHIGEHGRDTLGSASVFVFTVDSGFTRAISRERVALKVGEALHRLKVTRERGSYFRPFLSGCLFADT